MITYKFHKSLRDPVQFRCPYYLPAEVFGEGYQFFPNIFLILPTAVGQMEPFPMAPESRSALHESVLAKGENGTEPDSQ